jgi:hypothetical protein
VQGVARGSGRPGVEFAEHDAVGDAERIAGTGVAAAAGDDSEGTAHLHERGQVDVGFFGGSMRCRRRTIKTQIIDLSVVIASELFLT